MNTSISNHRIVHVLQLNSSHVMHCSGFQPPEFIDKGEISEKFDIFSLGVIIIKIVSGPEGYPKCQYMPSEEFIDQVRNDVSFE